MIVVHGGAGASTRERIGDARADAGLATVDEALRRGAEVLTRGGHALDAVVAAVTVLEDGEELNAGRGASLNEAGVAELSAAVADGRDRRAGAVAGATVARNPVELAHRVLLDGRHVLMVGEGADALARQWGVSLEDPSYFVTERSRDALARSSDTVGAVALDRDGHLAAATSTGGITGQRVGRVGDAPLVGAGTWADDRTCAVSATGYGEFFIRAAFAHQVHARLLYAGEELAAACEAALQDVLALGGTGGCVAVDRAGNIAMPFTSAAMFRGWCAPGGEPVTALDR